jgi:hypothetical protein
MADALEGVPGVSVMPEEASTIEIPASLNEITADWASSALREAGVLRRGAVGSVQVLPSRVGHGTISVNAELRLTYDAGDTGLPCSMFIKLAPQDDTSTRYDIGCREAAFYTEIAPSLRLRTPVCYYSAINHRHRRYVILMESIAGATCGDWAAGCSVDQARLSIERIAQLHGQWWEHASLAEKGWLKTWDFPSWQESYAKSLDSFRREVQGQLPEEVIAAADRLADRFVDIMEGLHYGHPVTLVHGDYQLDNLFFGTPGTDDDLIVVDWQMAGLGRGAIDVANFLGGNIDPAVRQSAEADLLKTYQTVLLDAGVDYTLEECMHDYRLSMVPRLARAVIRIAGRLPGTTDQVRERLEGVIFPRYFKAFVDLKAWEFL